MSNKYGGPITQSIFKLINLVVMGRSLSESLAIKEKYNRVQEGRFKVIRNFITFCNIWLLKATGGRLGNSFLGVPLMLMTTIGRKSGQPRTLPIYYLEDGERIVLVASNGGLPSDPVWYLNVRANPAVTVHVRGVRRDMIVREATPEEREHYWPRLTERFPMWQEVYERSNRNFPVVILESRA